MVGALRRRGPVMQQMQGERERQWPMMMAMVQVTGAGVEWGEWRWSLQWPM